MTDRSFGGPWTQEKLQILRLYLNAYTTALKSQPFRLTYVDAFAGEGTWRPGSAYSADYDDFRELHKGSARIALEIQDKPFDRLIFVEKDIVRCNSLELLRSEFSHRDIKVLNEDAAIALPIFCERMGRLDRAVVFLDPFATEVSWSLVEKLAQTRKIDCWILFPLGAISRMMPTANEPPPQLANQLDRIFGGREFWQEMYTPSSQLSLFGEDPGQVRASGSDQIANLYRERLKSVFERVAPSGRALRNSRNSPMFLLIFAASNPVGATTAVKIAAHIIDNW